MLFLGSSVTYGACSGGYSFVEALAERTGLIPVKEAVSGTTLADVDDASYIARMLRLPQGTVKSRMARGRTKLRELLEEEVLGE